MTFERCHRTGDSSSNGSPESVQSLYANSSWNEGIQNLTNRERQSCHASQPSFVNDGILPSLEFSGRSDEHGAHRNQRELHEQHEQPEHHDRHERREHGRADERTSNHQQHQEHHSHHSGYCHGERGGDDSDSDLDFDSSEPTVSGGDRTPPEGSGLSTGNNGGSSSPESGGSVPSDTSSSSTSDSPGDPQPGSDTNPSQNPSFPTVPTSPSLPTDSTPATPSASGTFTERDGKLYDPDGKQFIPSGLCVTMNQALTESDQLVNQYKFNFLRVSGSTNSDGTPNFAAMDQAAAIYSKLGVPVQFEYPITDNQSVFTGSDLTRAENWYSQVAAHFKDNPYVWLATPNESGNGSTNTSQWLTQTTGILSAINDAGNKNPVLVDDTNWSGAAIGGNPDSSSLIKYASQLFAADPNLIAAEHDYSADPNHAASNLSEGISALKNAGYTPMIQEFGVFNTGNPNSDQPGVNAVLSQATMEQGVGYVGYIDTYGDSAQKETQDAGPENKDALILPDGSLSDYGKQVVAQNQVVQNYLQSVNGDASV